jgi:hypothetical protein
MAADPQGPMARPQPFETILARLAESEVGAAAANDPLTVLKAAQRRLVLNPALRSLAPDGRIAYGDPVLSVAHYWAETAAAGVGAAAVEGDDLRESWSLRWMLAGVRDWLNRNAREFRDLAARVPTRALRIEKPVARIAVLGDAGYRGEPQAKVLRGIARRHAESPFDLVVHLGDTYFAGAPGDFLIHLLAPLRGLGIPFVTLCGNHDLYSGPVGFLATLDVIGDQPGRFFLIETPAWRIACLDTAFGAARWLRNDGTLDKAQLAWLDRLLTAPDPRPLILMSHHYTVSGWEDPAASLNRQMKARSLERVFAWYWGHEHRAACYDRSKVGFYGACVGNGAFLEQVGPPEPFRAAPEWHAKGRCTCLGDTASSWWPHGFLELELRASRIDETWRLEGDEIYRRTLV